MSYAPVVKLDEIGDAYGDRTWVEYGLKQSKDCLGWVDFRVTDYPQIERVVGDRHEYLHNGEFVC